jgi:AcrR family transcriptional regulator
MERRTEAEEALLEAAAELFAERGITQTSLAQIGERAGYSRGLANHHFGSKDALIERLAERARVRFRQMLEDRLRQDNRADTGRAAVLAIADIYITAFVNPRSTARALLVMWGSNFPRDIAVQGIVESDDLARRNLARWIRRGQDDGSISGELDADALAPALLGLVRGVSAQLLVSPDAFDPEAVRRECSRIVALALDGGAAPSGGGGKRNSDR